MYLLEVGFCAGTSSIWKLVGNILSIFKIVIPLLVIIFGMIDLGKAVVGSKPEEISKQAKALGFRIIAGVVIFFVPTLIGFAFSLADGFNADGDYSICETCITDPGSCPKQK